ncbi:hypothetical protein, partial [Streptacidiphilus sp. EB129]|uniref:hypothetical protein n=1 Tax=Streptacidiphilus sp. EB129 TaxID=3156262 RepID=UPI00351865F5
WIADHDLGTPTVLVTVDARGLAKVGTVTFSPECTAAGLVASCPEQMTLNPSSSWETSLFTVTAFTTAKLGVTGRYTVSGTLAGAVVKGGSGVITVGGPEYQLDPLGRYPNLKVGATFSQPVSFGNIGTRPAAGTDVVLQLSPGLRFTQHYRNCLYQTTVRGGVRYDLQAVCRFTDMMRIGEKVALAQPVRLQVTPQALWTYLDVSAEPAGDASLTGGGWHRGTDPALGLKRLVAGKPSTVPPGTVQLVDYPGSGSAIVTARNGADYGVTGGSAKAVAGGDATIRVLMQNHGPAVLFDRSGGEATPFVKVTAPPGATVVPGPDCNTVSSTVEYCSAG